MHTHQGDRILLTTLQQIGVDMAKRREVNFYFVFPAEENAKRAQSLLNQRQLQTDCHSIPVPWWKKLFTKPQWSICVTQQMNLDEKQVMAMTTLFTQIAENCGGLYDGWEASVEGDNLNMDALQ